MRGLNGDVHHVRAARACALTLNPRCWARAIRVAKSYGKNRRIYEFRNCLKQHCSFIQKILEIVG